MKGDYSTIWSIAWRQISLSVTCCSTAQYCLNSDSTQPWGTEQLCTVRYTHDLNLKKPDQTILNVPLSVAKIPLLSSFCTDLALN